MKLKERLKKLAKKKPELVEKPRKRYSDELAKKLTERK